MKFLTIVTIYILLPTGLFAQSDLQTVLKGGELLLSGLTIFKTNKGTTNKDSKVIESVCVKNKLVTPAKDFGFMFETLLDYKYENRFVDNKSLPESFINDLNSLNAYANLSAGTLARGNCSCRWCLGMGTTGTYCKPTDSGCGFLWLQSCNQCILCL